MELTLTLNDSCEKKITALARLKQMNADELEMFLAEGLESVLTVSIFDELGMSAEDIGLSRPTQSVPSGISFKKQASKQEETQEEVFDQNQHNLSSESDDEETSEETEEPKKKAKQDPDSEFDFSFVESNIKNAISSDSVDDDQLADDALAIGDNGDDDEPVLQQRARNAVSRFTKPKARVLDATYGN
jgi:hypothetical protein